MNVPHEVGGFVLEHELGRGGMGVVYRARDPRLDRPVALKVILGDPSPQERERFRVEAAAAARLDHPNLVRVLSAGEAQGRPFLALEYVEGESLSQRLRRVGRCDALLAARIVAQLARGVAHAHERGVIHRDIKPDNVLLVGDTPRLTDFGLARLGERHLTQTGTVLGTPAYMAPEQAAGEVDRIGPQSDVYALGAVLYALLAGHPPFRGTSAINTLRRVMDEPPPPIPQLPAGLRKILFRALEKEPAQRTASAADLAWELEGWARELERPASPARAAGPRWPLALALVSSLIAAGMLGWTRLSPAEPHLEPTAPNAPDAEDPAEEAQRLAEQVAAAREARRWDDAERLLAAAPRDPQGRLPAPLAFEAAYLDVALFRSPAAVEPLAALARRAPGPLAARTQALLALAAARCLRWDESAAASAAARPRAEQDYLVARLLGEVVQERLRLKRDRGAKPQAAELFTLAIELGDPSADPHAHLVRVTPPVADQRERLRTLVEEHPSGLAYGLLAAHYAYVEPRVWDTALELIERSVAADPRDPQSLAAAGNLYVGWLQAHRSTAPEKLARAEALLEGALELAPEDPLVLERFAYGWRILGEQFPAQAGGVGPEALARYTRARELMLSTLGRYPGCFGARKELVDCVRHLEGPAQALVALAPLLELYPQEGELHYIRYKFLGELRRYDEALQAIEAAARLEPERADFNELARRFRAQLGR